MFLLSTSKAVHRIHAPLAGAILTALILPGCEAAHDPAAAPSLPYLAIVQLLCLIGAVLCAYLTGYHKGRADEIRDHLGAEDWDAIEDWERHRLHYTIPAEPTTTQTQTH